MTKNKIIIILIAFVALIIINNDKMRHKIFVLTQTTRAQRGLVVMNDKFLRRAKRERERNQVIINKIINIKQKPLPLEEFLKKSQCVFSNYGKSFVDEKCK